MLLSCSSHVLSPGCGARQQQQQQQQQQQRVPRLLPARTIRPLSIPQRVQQADYAPLPAAECVNKMKASMEAPSVAAAECGRLQQYRDAAVAAAEAGMFSAAAASFRLALQLDPSSAALHEQLAQCLMEGEQHEAALQAAEAAVTLQPDWPAAWVTLGRACLNTCRPQAAVEAFSRSLALQPGQAGVAAELGEAAELAQQAVARQVGLPGLAVRPQPAGQSGPGCIIWEAGVQLARLLVSSSNSSSSNSSSSAAQQQHAAMAGCDVTACAAARAPAALLPAAAGAVAGASRQPCSTWKQLTGASVLEVGSGTGIVGITAAALGAHVTLTDLPELQQLLAANIAANASLISAAGGSAATAVLDWNRLPGSSSSQGQMGVNSSSAGNCSSSSAGGAQDSSSSSSSNGVLLHTYDWAIGADLVFNAGQVELVARMMAALLGASRDNSEHKNSKSSSSSSRSSRTRCGGFLLAHKLRHQQVDQQLQEALRLAGLHVAVVAQRQQQQQQGRCSHQPEQQPDHEQQQDTAAAGSEHLEAPLLLELSACGGGVIWWITAHSQLGVEASAEHLKGLVQPEVQQSPALDEPQHAAALQQQQEQQQQRRLAGMEKQPSSRQGQEQQRSLRRWQQHHWHQRWHLSARCQQRGCRQHLRRQRRSAALHIRQQPRQQQQQQQQRRLPSKLLLLSAGLAGVGKSTVLKLLASCLGSSCVYLDKDTINQALLGEHPYFSDYYKQHVQQQTYAVMFGVAADNLASQQQCTVLLDGQFGDKLTAGYVQPYLQAIRSGKTLARHFGQAPAGTSEGRTAGLQQQQQQQGWQRVAAVQDLPSQKTAGANGTGGCLVVLLLFDTGGCSQLQLQRLRARGLARDEGKYAMFEQYRLQELQLLQQQLKLAMAGGLLDGVVEVDTSQDPATCVKHIMRQLALLGGKMP